MTRESLQEALNDLIEECEEIVKEGLALSLGYRHVDTIIASRVRKSCVWRLTVSRRDDVHYVFESPLRSDVRQMLRDELADIEADLKLVQS